MSGRISRQWTRLGPRFLPFADAASAELPLTRLLRLSLFQITVGMATALLVGTLNRVMIVELNVPAWLVALMVALPLIFAPFRALIGFKSDHHVSALGWRRVPYIWMGTLLQFGGLAIMPFALLVLSGEGTGPVWVGQLGAAFAFLLVGAGLQTTQTAGLALATDLAPPHTRPKVVALMYVMLLSGVVVSGFAFGHALADFSPTRLIQVIQAAASITMVLNLIALWKQEPRNPTLTARERPRPAFGASWRAFVAQPRARRYLVAVGLGTAAFNMQDIVLEPYGGEVLHLSVGSTTMLTALLAGGALLAFVYAARALARGADAYRLAAYGATVGLFAFAAVVFAAPMDAPQLFRAGTLLIGFGGGLFSVGTLTVAMNMDSESSDAHGTNPGTGLGAGLALGAWGAVQATCAGVAVAAGGAVRDLVNTLGSHGLLGEAMSGPAAGYGVVYHIELLLLFITLVAIGPLVRRTGGPRPRSSFGLAEFPG